MHHDAVFVRIVRMPDQSPLSPSEDLLEDYKLHGLSWAEYVKRFKAEMIMSAGAHDAAQVIRDLARTKDVYLVCYEKTDARCHRRIVKEMIEAGEL